MWGMSHSLPSGMSRYAFSPQDADFTSSYPGTNSRRVYNDFSGGGGSGSTMSSVGNMVPAASTNSLSCADVSNAGGVNGTNLIVNYLPQDMTDRELYALFRTIGPVNTCRIMRDFKVNFKELI
ncbi:sex-lethal homolog isoform X2 [Teleopsis dalmanni]|nr:sex-lethal homolog isoform X2 [Teleopsis dalmanni]XP_037933507.1 sex-lethal homolog isoform X2 [Teleopsis dalmanni]